MKINTSIYKTNRILTNRVGCCKSGIKPKGAESEGHSDYLLSDLKQMYYFASIKYSVIIAYNLTINKKKMFD